MGSVNTATCNDCGHTFRVSGGGGFLFYELRCEKCGASKQIRHDEVNIEVSDAKSGMGKHDRSEIERLAGSCRCGGRFTFDAKPRCPKCKSVDIEVGEPTLFYD